MVTLCSRQEFTEEVQIKIIEKTLEHGEDGPAVSLWVVTCLLNLAYNDVQSNGSGREVGLLPVASLFYEYFFWLVLKGVLHDFELSSEH